MQCNSGPNEEAPRGANPRNVHRERTEPVRSSSPPASGSPYPCQRQPQRCPALGLCQYPYKDQLHAAAPNSPQDAVQNSLQLQCSPLVDSSSFPSIESLQLSIRQSVPSSDWLFSSEWWLVVVSLENAFLFSTPPSPRGHNECRWYGGGVSRAVGGRAAVGNDIIRVFEPLLGHQLTKKGTSTTAVIDARGRGGQWRVRRVL